MKFIVFGLGSFGSSLAGKLVTLGHEVIGVDHRAEMVDKWKEAITHTITMDATSREAMQTLPVRDVDAVIVAIGETPGVSIMVTALLKQMGVKRIINRVISPLQQTVLETMGIDEFTSPEAESAERLAYRLDVKGVLDSHRVTDRYKLAEVNLPARFAGLKVGDIPFEAEYEVKLVTVIRQVESRNIFGAVYSARKALGLVGNGLELRQDDRLLLFGEEAKLEEFMG
ncbi:MAG: potassium channel family protein [Bacteroidota bacterium]